MAKSATHHIPWGALGPWLALLGACIFFATQSDRFLTGENLSLILQQVMVVGVIAIGQTLIILTAGIDLSCGMVMALGGIIMTKFATELGMPVPVAILCGIGVTTLFGLVNGLLVTRIKLPPFIVPWATPPKPRGWSAFRRSACCSAFTWRRACCTASPRCCRWRAPAWAIRMRARPRTSTPSRRWCSAAPASSVGAALCWAR